MSKRKASGEAVSQPKQESKVEAPQGPTLPQQLFRTETVMVNGPLAKEWLKRNFERNRTLNQSGIDRYVASMVSGKWEYNPQPIVFKGDTLVDGQHRLTALVLASEEKPGLAIPMLVAYGPDTMSTRGLDRGTSRSHGHVLELEGLVARGMGNKLSTYARGLLALCLNQTEPGSFESVAEDIMRKSGQDLMRAYESLIHKHAVGPNVSAVAYALPVSRSEIEKLLLVVKNNDGLVKDTGAWHLRRVFAGDLKSGKSWKRDARLYRSLMVLKCIQMHLEGRSVGELKVVTSFDGKDIDPAPLTFFRKEREKCGVGELVF